MKMSDEKLRVLRDEVFGPCTVIGECFSLEELRDDLAEYAGRPGGLRASGLRCGWMMRPTTSFLRVPYERSDAEIARLTERVRSMSGRHARPSRLIYSTVCG